MFRSLRWIAPQLVALLLGYPAAAQQLEVVSVTPRTVTIQAGGDPAVVRLTLRGTPRISQMRFMLGRQAASGLTATPKPVRQATTREGSTSVYDVAISAAESAADGRYSLQLVSSTRSTVTLPLEIHVARPAQSTASRLRAGTVVSSPTSSTSSRLPVATSGGPRKTVPRTLAVTVGCRGTAVPIQAGGVAALGERTLSGPGPYVVTFCATDGYASYDWQVTRIVSAPGAPHISDLRASGEQVSPTEYRVTINRAASRMQLRVRISASSSQAAEPAHTGEAEVIVSAPDFVAVGQPTITRYWVTAPRPGGSVRLENQGIFDPTLTGDAADGEFWLEGHNLDGPGLRLRLWGNGGEYDATPLSKSTSGSLQVIRAKIGPFRSSRLFLSHMGGSARTDSIPRLGYWAFPTAEFSELLGALSCRIGSPVGTARIELPNGQTITSTVPPFGGFGMQGNVVDLRSRRFTLQTASGTRGRSVVLVMKVEFETDGPEFRGSLLADEAWLPTIPFEGDLGSPVAEFRTTLELNSATGKLEARRVTGSFSATVSLRSGMGAVPLGPLEGLVLGQVSDQLTDFAEDGKLGDSMAAFVNQQVQTFTSGGRIRYIDRLPGGALYIEYRR